MVSCAARAASVGTDEGVVDGGKAQADKTQHTHLEVQGASLSSLAQSQAGS